MLGLSIIKGKYQIVLFNTIRRMLKLIISLVNCIFYKNFKFYKLWFRFLRLEKHAWQKPCSSPTNITEVMLHSENKSYRSFFFFYPSFRVNTSISGQLQKDILFSTLPFQILHFDYTQHGFSNLFTSPNVSPLTWHKNTFSILDI